MLIFIRSNFSVILTIWIVLLLSTQGQGQKINYRIIEDDPDQANTNFIAPELGMEFNSTDLGVFIGANGRKSISKLTIEAVVRYDVVNLNSSSATFHAEGGVFLPLNSKIKQKEVPIFLSYNPYAGKVYDGINTYNIEETKFITVPSGQYKNTFGVRGGIHARSMGVEDEVNSIAPGNILLGGIYGGFQLTSQAYVRAHLDEKEERIGAGFTRLYADILLFPVTELSRSDLEPAAKSDGFIGWRVGYQWYISPHEGEYKFFGNSVFGAEIGMRPLSGFMFNITWGYALNRS